MRTLGGLVIVGALARLAVAQPVEDTPPAPPTADELFAEGRTLLEGGQPGQACLKFSASLRIAPESLGTILNLGLCNEQLDRLATALRWFRRAQIRASELHETDTESAAKKETSTLAAKVPTLKIEFTHPAPAGTVVEIDGTKTDEIDYARIEVDAGIHRIAMTAPNQHPAFRELTLEDSDTQTITLPITVVEPPPVKQVPVAVDRGPAQRREAYVLGSVGAGLLLSDLALGLVARNKFDETDMLDTRDRWKNIMRFGGTSLFVAGGVAIGGAVWLYLKAPREHRVEVAPAVGQGAAGLTVSGRF